MGWEPYFKASEANLTSIAIWVRFPELPIAVLQIDSYTATGSRESYARLCIQLDTRKPLITSIKVGRSVQQVMYESLSSLCFCCGHLGHKLESCPYSIKENEKASEEMVEDQI